MAKLAIAFLRPQTSSTFQLKKFLTIRTSINRGHNVAKQAYILMSEHSL